MHFFCLLWAPQACPELPRPPRAIQGGDENFLFFFAPAEVFWVRRIMRLANKGITSLGRGLSCTCDFLGQSVDATAYRTMPEIASVMDMAYPAYRELEIDCRRLLDLVRRRRPVVM